MSDRDVLGPIEFALVAFPRQASTSDFAVALGHAVDAGLIQIYDVVAIHKAADGTVSGVEISDPALVGGSELSVFAGAHSGLLDDDDIVEAGATLEADAIGVLLVYENLWAVPIVAAAHSQGGGLVAGTMISAQNIVEQLAALEAAD